MIEAARWNLQHGVKEDLRHLYTTYTPDNALDLYVLNMVKNREKVNAMRQQKEFEKAAAAELEKVLQQELDKLLKDFQ